MSKKNSSARKIVQQLLQIQVEFVQMFRNVLQT